MVPAHVVTKFSKVYDGVIVPYALFCWSSAHRASFFFFLYMCKGHHTAFVDA